MYHIEYKTSEFPNGIIIEKYILLYNLSKSYFVNQICLISKYFNFVSNNNEYKFSIASILNTNYLCIVNGIQFLVITSATVFYLKDLLVVIFYDYILKLYTFWTLTRLYILI